MRLIAFLTLAVAHDADVEGMFGVCRYRLGMDCEAEGRV